MLSLFGKKPYLFLSSFKVAILCRLQNPFIIGFLGVCRIPLCFGLELAPKGGLFSIIDDIAHRRDLVSQECPNNPPIMDSVLGRKLTYKIALQVSSCILIPTIFVNSNYSNLKAVTSFGRLFPNQGEMLFTIFIFYSTLPFT